MDTEEDKGITNYLDLRSPLGLISFNTKPSLRQYDQCEFLISSYISINHTHSLFQHSRVPKKKSINFEMSFGVT